MTSRREFPKSFENHLDFLWSWVTWGQDTQACQKTGVLSVSFGVVTGGLHLNIALPRGWRVRRGPVGASRSTSVWGFFPRPTPFNSVIRVLVPGDVAIA